MFDATKADRGRILSFQNPTLCPDLQDTMTDKPCTMTTAEVAASECLQIPVELFSVIGGFLAGDLCFGTLANLNVASKAVMEETLPVLYETIFLQWSESLCGTLRDKGEGVQGAWKHVK
jgi:hypothetical protein